MGISTFRAIICILAMFVSSSIYAKALNPSDLELKLQKTVEASNASQIVDLSYGNLFASIRDAENKVFNFLVGSSNENLANPISNNHSTILSSENGEITIRVATNNLLLAENDLIELSQKLLNTLNNVEQAPITIQFLHASDLEGGVEALGNAPNFAAIMEGLSSMDDNTIILSAGDNYIPGPFFNAAGDPSLRDVIQEVHQEFFDEPGLTNLRETPGRIDISIMNIIGFDASAIGNHEFDAGPDAFSIIIGTDIRGDGLGDTRWLGAQFPYLSSNFDYSTEGALAGLATTDQFLPNTAFQSLPSDLEAAGNAPKIAPSTIIERGGEQIGVIGATTQILKTITSAGSLEGLTPQSNDMAALAGIIQPIIDGFEAEGINKIVVVSHLQQEALEQELATLLSGVDVIFAGGSDVLRAQADDTLRPGDEAAGVYPFTTTNADGDPVAVVGSPGEYKYVGRLIVEFDENGVVVEESLSNPANGMYASLDETVTAVAGAEPFAMGTDAELVQRLTNAIGDLVNEQDGNLFGKTSVFIEGRREAVRTQETNMGNLTADANLSLAQSVDGTVEASLKNGGGIRAAIGQIVDLGNGTSELAPPPANPSVGKEEGDISQLDIVNTLRFNNGLSLLTLTIPEFKEVLEYGFAATTPGSTPGRFPQIGGFSVTIDTSMAEGSQVLDVTLIGANGEAGEQLIADGEIIASEERTIRIVTLDFLAGGGDGYPYPELSNADRVDLSDVITEGGTATFADPGTEQDALAEYLLANYSETPFGEADTPVEEDSRIIFSDGESMGDGFSLQFLHASDLEGGVEALGNAPNFAAIMEGLSSMDDNTIILSAGDNYIPGPFFNAAGDPSLRDVIQEVHQEFFDEPGLTNLRETPGRIDISIMNIIGFDASAIGNHEFDAGPDAFSIIIGTDIRGDGLGDTRWLGAQFPYLSSNFDYSTEGALAGLATTDQFLPNTAFQSLPSDLEAAGNAPKIAPSTIIERGGEQIGVIGATTQILKTITSAGSLEGLTPQSNDMAALAGIIQPIIDGFEAEGINKIVVVSHLQQEALEQELATLLSGVDVIFAGGSDVLRAQADDTLRPGDEAAGVYPFTTTNADGDPVAVVGSPGEYKYVGRLIVEFDENGVVVEESLSNPANGMYASLDETVTAVAGAEPFAMGTDAELVQRLTNAIGDLVNEQDGNLFGKTSVFIEGRREAVRTQETNMGNLTADANLSLAQSVDGTVEASLKNGGGIRAAIGQIVDLGNGTSELAPPPANPSVGKEEGDISQLDIVNTLRFNNGLSLLTLTIPEFKEVLEYGFAATTPGSTPGRFPQIGGFSVTIDTSMAEGSQVLDVTLIGANGEAGEQLIADGEIIASEERTIRIVTLDFLAGGGDGYPYPELSNADRVDLSDVITEGGTATFADPGTEQDALAEYLLANYSETPFGEADTPVEEDSRIIFSDGESMGDGFSLQFLHASDLEGGVEALGNAPNFAAIMEGLSSMDDNTIILSAGDNYIPGPFFNAAGDPSLRDVIQEVHQEFFDEPGLTNLRETPGRIDISIMNIIGFDASAIGNHEFDAGPDAFSIIIGTDIRGDGLGDTRWLGAQFPYLSSNFDYSTEGALAGLATTDQFLPNTAFQSLPSDLEAAGNAPKIAPSTIIERGGEQIGVIGATTQILKTITSAGSLEGLTPQSNDMAALAGIIQPIIDGFEAEGINKIVVVSHLQQEALEQELATLLSGVDVIFAGGSDVLRAQADDTLRPGDEAAGVYPFTTTNADGDPVAVVGSPGEYKYVGRLIVEFDENGVVVEESLSNPANGMYASLDETVTAVAGAEPFAMGTDAELVQRLTNAIGDLVNEQDGNLFGKTSVFIEGRREAVRTQETNMGNLTADANLSLAQSVDGTVEASLKNGGGIRAAIGQIVDLGNGTSELAPPPANPSVGKEEGDISQLDIVNTLRFNNGLSLLTLTIPEFKEVLEYGFAATTPGSTPGRFPQIGGFSVTIDTSMAEGSQVLDVTLIDANGEAGEQLIADGEIIASEDRTIRIVTLDFLAGGGDGYPYPELSNADRVDLSDVITEGGTATFADPGTEQDALAEYLLANYSETPFGEADTPVEEDERIIFTMGGETNQAPNAIFTADPTAGVSPLEVRFDASGASDADGTIESYEWDFGDGSTGTGEMTNHTYEMAGTFTVTLTVTDDDGATATSTQTITVEEGNQTGTARVQIIHNADSETVQVLVNGAEFLPSLAYRTATPYVDVPAGTPLEITLLPVNEFSSFPDPVTVTATFEDGETYVVMAYGTFDDQDDFPVEVAVFAGAVEMVGDQEVALQFFHGSNDAGDVDITLEDGTVLFDDVSYGGFGSEYLVVPADRYTLNVTPATDNANVVATYSAGFSFWKRRSAVIFATELLGDGTFQPWVALSNGGTYPLSRLEGLVQPEIFTQRVEDLGEVIRLAPNPATDITSLTFDLPKESATNIVLLNANGKLLRSFTYGQLGVGLHTVDIDLADFGAGYYYIQLQSGELTKVRPLIITK